MGTAQVKTEKNQPLHENFRSGSVMVSWGTECDGKIKSIKEIVPKKKGHYKKYIVEYLKI